LLRLFAWLILCFAIAILGAFFYLFRTEVNPAVNISSMQAKSWLLPMRDWRASFQSCATEAAGQDQTQQTSEVLPSCQSLGQYYYLLQLPFVADKAQREETTGANRVVLSYTFTETELKWLSSIKEVDLVFSRIFGTFSHLALNGKIYSKSHQRFGDIIFKLRTQDLLLSERLEVDFVPTAEMDFGPQQLPPVLSLPAVTSEILKMPERALNELQVVRGLEFAVVLFLAILAIVLDHKRSFTLLAAYFIFRMIKSYSVFYLETKSVYGGTPWFEYLPAWFEGMFFVASGAAIYVMPFFVLQVLDQPHKRALGHRFSSAAVGIYLGSSLLMDRTTKWLYSDIIAESLAAAVILAIIAILVSNATKQHRPSQGKEPVHTSEPIKFALVAVGAAFALWANYAEYASLESTSLKSTLSPFFLVFPAMMVITALIDVGSTSKTMEKNAEIYAKNELIAKDVKQSQSFQDALIPPRKLAGRGWRARGFYYPSLTLAGDWYFVNECVLGESRFLAICLVDVVGHGVAAGILSAVAASEWHQWLQKQVLTPNLSPEERISLHSLELSQALENMKNQKDCAVTVCLLDLDSRELWYQTAGQPPILWLSESNLKFLNSRSGRLTSRQAPVVQKAQLEANDSLILFTDGIIPPSTPFSRWQRQLTGHFPLKKTVFFLISAIKDNKRLFRADRATEDDMTAVIIELVSEENIASLASGKAS
jgi:serine phosphatase RsbU (regulator of sigma subunit)